MDRNNATTINGVVVEPLPLNNHAPSTSKHAHLHAHHGHVNHNNNKVKRIVRNHSFKAISSPQEREQIQRRFQPLTPNSGPLSHAPVEKARAKAMQAVDYYNSNVVLNGNGGGAPNGGRDNYKSLGDVFGTEANMKMAHGGGKPQKAGLNKNASLPLNGHLQGGGLSLAATSTPSGGVKPARSITSMNMPPPQHVPLSRNPTSNYSSTNNNNRFGNPEMRASYNDRIGSRSNGTRSNYTTSSSNQVQGPFSGHNSGLYKSNSSLDLDHEVDMVNEAIAQSHAAQGHAHHHGHYAAPPMMLTTPNHGSYRREFGSHGSIDVITRQEMAAQHVNGHAHYSSDRSYDSSSIEGGGAGVNGAVTNGGGPAAMSTLTRRPDSDSSAFGVNSTPSGVSAPAQSVMSSSSQEESPKQKKKGFFHSQKEAVKSQKSLFKKLRGSSTKEGNSHDSVGKTTSTAQNGVNGAELDSLDRQLEDRHRRRFFLHHDIGSVCASLSATTHLKTLERRNTTTGASAASAALRNSDAAKKGDNVEKDPGDNISNDLVLR